MPCGFMSVTARHTAPKIDQSRNTRSRGRLSHMASRPKTPANPMPKIQLACMLTHRMRISPLHNGGALFLRRASMSSMVHIVCSTNASIWGRISMVGASAAATMITASMARCGARHCPARMATIVRMIARAPVASSASPVHDPASKASAITTSESHSCATHGRPTAGQENGSAVGMLPVRKINWPVARCQLVS